MGSGVETVIAQMQAQLEQMKAKADARRFFHATYLRTTQAVAAEIVRGGFADSIWLDQWDVAFAEFYLDALAADFAGEHVPGPWRVAFAAARQHADWPPLRHVLFGMNAHINYDLPQALLAVMSPADFDDPEVVRQRKSDHEHLDEVLQARVGAEDNELKSISNVTWVDRLMQPANRAASRRFLREARAKVWQNALTLDRARRVSSEAYDRGVAELERRSEARLAELAAPGPVLLRLARRGFGVLISNP